MSPPGPGPHLLPLAQNDWPRQFLVHVPPDHEHRGALPIVMVLHGMGGTALWTVQETQWDQLADREGFLLVVPEALPLDPGQPMSFWKNPTRWRDGHLPERDQQTAVDDGRYLLAVLDEVQNRFAVNRRRVFVTGFSNGAGMTFCLAATHAERLTAIAPVSGTCRLEHPRPARPVPTLYLIGTEDPLVPLAGGVVRTLWGWVEQRTPVREMLGRWSEAMGGEILSQRIDEEEGVLVERFPHPQIDFLFYQIAGLGHHWPGGRGQLSRRLFGPPSKRVRATELIWRFFQRVGG